MTSISTWIINADSTWIIQGFFEDQTLISRGPKSPRYLPDEIVKFIVETSADMSAASASLKYAKESSSPEPVPTPPMTRANAEQHLDLCNVAKAEGKQVILYIHSDDTVESFSRAARMNRRDRTVVVEQFFKSKESQRYREPGDEDANASQIRPSPRFRGTIPQSVQQIFFTSTPCFALELLSQLSKATQYVRVPRPLVALVKSIAHPALLLQGQRKPWCTSSSHRTPTQRRKSIQKEHTETEIGLSEMQFGFRKSRSTIDAIRIVVNTARSVIAGKRWRCGTKNYCAIITLDVKNAFNSARWSRVLQALMNLGVPDYVLKLIRSYFSERILLYHTDEGTKRYKVTAGVPQGSVLGPTLWNIMYVGVLRVQFPQGVKIVSYADDIAIVVRAKHLEDVTLKANRAIRIV
ncbi:unnamed protein product [Trichogramma brassicae]|uniref:Reverse transcriptase domain-containing protein n=1 Tax=Trichogramma brassicae TaxID=86971 RepID=A0A6H5I406_9HYME|nr:unnamed protein product [Trichogramma brassicae]